jgi:hypothetical protein
MIERNKAYYHHKKQLASKQNILASWTLKLYFFV